MGSKRRLERFSLLLVNCIGGFTIGYTISDMLLHGVGWLNIYILMGAMAACYLALVGQFSAPARTKAKYTVHHGDDGMWYIYKPDSAITFGPYPSDAMAQSRADYYNEMRW